MSAGPRRYHGSSQVGPSPSTTEAPIVSTSVDSGTTPDHQSALGNADYPWDLFDSDAYLRHNYHVLQEPDRVIIGHLASFFSSLAAGARWHGVDVGSGTNLYPALAMLPLTRSITLWEYSRANVRWLQHGLRPHGQVWDPFWEALAASASIYRRLPRARALLPERAKVVKASIFELPEASWEIGTMFFVAESITGVREEFETATEKYLRALKPGAPFAAAFMRNSRGYVVGEHRFPAVAVTEQDIEELLRRIGAEARVERVSSAHRLREGYDGMVLATGWRSVAGGRGRRRGR